MRAGTRVVLRTFNGRASSPRDCRPDEDYWRLIGTMGHVEQGGTVPARILVRFEADVSALGLTCHNAVPNALHIAPADLAPVVAIRPAAPADTSAMAEILSDWIAATPWMPVLHTREETDAFCAGLVPRALVAEADGRVAGFLAREGEEVDALYVAGRMRRRGIGGALLRAAQAAAPSLTLWTFAANAPARRFYAAHGFREVGGTRGQNAEGLPDVRLEWRRG